MNPRPEVAAATPTRPRARRRSRLLAAAAGVLAFGLALTACSSTGTPGTAATTTPAVQEPVSGGTLVWAIETTLSSANPHINGQDKARPILRNAFDSYLYRADDGTFQPWLAESYEETEDGKVVTLKLREDVTFSDGDAFNAAAVVKNFDRITDGQYVTSSVSALRFLESYTATDEYTVTFRLSQPDNYFLLWLSLVNSAPLSPTTLDLPLDQLQAGGTQLAGTGPFTISGYTLSTEITFSKRADYAWAPEAIADGQTAAYLDTVTYRTLKEGATRSGALEQGQVGIASDIQPLDVSTFADDPTFTYVRNTVSGTPYSLYLNVSKAPFDDIRVREAFAKGADLDAIIQSIYKGTYDRAYTPITEVGPFADASLEGWLTFDADEANKLLDEAGWTERNADGVRVKDGQTLTVRAVAGAAYVRESRDELNVAIGAALKQNVGIEYLFEPVDQGTEFERADANDYEVFDNSYGLADPVAALDLLYYSSDKTRGYIARGKYNDATLESLVDVGRFDTDLQTRKDAYLDLQQYVTDNYYVVPLVETQDTFAYVADTVHDVSIDPATGQPWGAYTVWVSK